MVSDFFMEKELFIEYTETPIGYLEIKTDKEALLTVSFVEDLGKNSNFQPEILLKTIFQLQQYFEGKRKVFDLNLAPEGTEFQQKVWRLVQNVNFGKTASYLDISLKTGSEKNTRAVGMANGKNPIPIIIPCHRIIGSSGKLIGYAGGIERKRWLLRHELKHSPHNNLLF